MDINFKKIKEIFRKVEGHILCEHEVYEVLHFSGIETPEFKFICREESVTEEDLSVFQSEKVVLKIVSPLIVHKSDMEGIAVVPKKIKDVNTAIKEMLMAIPEKVFKSMKAGHFSNESYNLTVDEIKQKIKGVLICEFIDYKNRGISSEILFGIRNTREFGPVITFGPGGVDVEFFADQFKEGKVFSTASAHMMGKKDIKEVVNQTSLTKRIVQPFRGTERLLSEDKLFDLYERFLKLGNYFSSLNDNKDGEFVIEEAEINPFVIKNGRLIPLDGMCRISKKLNLIKPRPFGHIVHLLKPKRIGIIGVSSKMNLGHIILNNILKNGFKPKDVVVVKPGIKEMEGCVCVPSIDQIPGIIDLFVLAVSADQSAEIIHALIQCEKARSVIIIAGGIGEKEGTRNLEKTIKSLLSEGREKGKLTPLINGGNCLGIFSRTGKYDTTFVQDYKLFALPRKKTKKAKLALISQSGAFMISCMSKLPMIEPAYAISIGNQIDLSLSDYMNYFLDGDEIDIFAVYIEGFLPGDGLEFVRASKKLLNKGKSVLVYKAGRTPEGRAATSGHTASIAGDYSVNRAVLEQAGVIVAGSIFEFETTMKNLVFLGDKEISGSRVGMISNAGFECVIMSDSLGGDYKLELASFSLETKKKLKNVMKPLGIDQLQDVRNPVDITPVADDKTFCLAVEAILDDPQVDVAVISPLPMSPAMQTLPPASFHGEDLTGKGRISNLLIEIFQNTRKSFVVNIDSGEIYQPMVDVLEKNGIPVFRHCDEAVRFLSQFVQFKLKQNPVKKLQ